MEYQTIRFDEEQDEIIILDQTKLPAKTEYVRLKTQEQIFQAIARLQVRGAPAIGVTAGFASFMAAKETAKEHNAKAQSFGFDSFVDAWKKKNAYLNSSRPTAVNLSWALARMERVCLQHKEDSLSDILAALKRESLCIYEEDQLVCRKIGEFALTLVKPHDGILTHCNAGSLAAVRYGTATAPMYVGAERGYQFKIYVDETRPLLQGARLTASELYEAGMDVTLLCDNMSASLMSQGKIQAVFVGCDRVAANGDTANKIGTSLLAIAARHYHVPFYVCAPTATIDFAALNGSAIPIEHRQPQEVTELWYQTRMAPKGIAVYNPAFDVTEAGLISGIITEYGVARPPYEVSLREQK